MPLSAFTGPPETRPHQCAPLTAVCQAVSLLSAQLRGHVRAIDGLLQASLLALAAAVGGCVQRADVATEERVIRDLDKKWVQAVAAKDTTAIANVYAEDANFLAPGAPAVAPRSARPGSASSRPRISSSPSSPPRSRLPALRTSPTRPARIILAMTPPKPTGSREGPPRAGASRTRASTWWRGRR